MLCLHVFEPLAVVSEPLGVVDNQLVAIVDLADKEVALLLVSLLQLTQLLHDFLGVVLQVLEHFGLDFVFLVNLLHAALHVFVLVVHFIFQDFALGLQIGQLEIDLLEDVQLAIGLEDSVSQIFDFDVLLLLFLPHLVDAVLVIDNPIDDRVDQFLHKVSRL